MKKKSRIISCLVLFVALQFLDQIQAQQGFIEPKILEPNKNPSIPLSTAPSNPQKPEQIEQIKKEAEKNEQITFRLPQHIRQQLSSLESSVELPITEEYSFIIGPGEQSQFKWDPSKNKDLKLIVNVFQIGAEGNLLVIKDAEEYQFLEIETKNPYSKGFNWLGKVYRSKIFTINFDTDFKILKFTNKNRKNVLVEIDVELLEFVVESGVPDDLLATSRNKISSILQESESTQVQRQHVYKWEWGYYENEKEQQLHILGFTGVELMAILLTSCAQMYCLKNLLDNRSIV